MAIRLILVCKEGPARNAYLREATSIGIEVDVVDSFCNLLKMMSANTYQGIMVDLITSVKAPREEKSLAQGVLGVFPLIQLKWDELTRSIHTISSGHAASHTLAHFIAHACQPFQPRAIRLTARKSLNFNVLIYENGKRNDSDAKHTVTINVSKGGCFLFSCENWPDDAEIRMVFQELTDQTPIPGTIRWRQPWGKSMAVCGIGVQFKQMTPDQKNQMEKQFLI